MKINSGYTHMHMRTYIVAEVETIPKSCTVNSQTTMCVFSSVLLCSKVKA